MYELSLLSEREGESESAWRSEDGDDSKTKTKTRPRPVWSTLFGICSCSCGCGIKGTVHYTTLLKVHPFFCDAVTFSVHNIPSVHTY